MCHREVVRLGKFHCDFFTAKAIDIGFQHRITAFQNQISIGRIGRIQAVFRFPGIVHAVVIVVGNLIVSIIGGITAGIFRIIDNTGSHTGHASATCGRTRLHFIDNARIHCIARKSTGTRKHTIVSILSRFGIYRIGNFERRTSFHFTFTNSPRSIIIGIQSIEIIFGIVGIPFHHVTRHPPHRNLCRLLSTIERSMHKRRSLAGRTRRTGFIVIIDKIHFVRNTFHHIAAVARVMISPVVINVVGVLDKHVFIVTARAIKTRRTTLVVR